MSLFLDIFVILVSLDNVDLYFFNDIIMGKECGFEWIWIVLKIGMLFKNDLFSCYLFAIDVWRVSTEYSQKFVVSTFLYNPSKIIEFLFLLFIFLSGKQKWMFYMYEKTNRKIIDIDNRSSIVWGINYNIETK